MEENALPTDEKPRFPLAKFAIAVVVTIILGLMGGTVAGRVRSRGDERPAQVAEVSGSSSDSAARTPGSDEVDALEAIESEAPDTTTGSLAEQGRVSRREAAGQAPPEAVVPSEGADISGFAAYLEAPDSAEEMYSEFTCPCCGKVIAECTCGMAVERKGFLSGAVAAGSNELETYLAYADQYGWDAFVAEEAKEAAREFRLAHVPEQRPQVAVEPLRIDLGQVSEAKGEATSTFTVRNDGQEDLVIDGLSTSCGCTTAALVQDGVEGPRLGPGTPTEGWSATLPPGGTAELVVRYDPTVHKGARGEMQRDVFVSTNDPLDGNAKVSIHLEQVE